MLIDKHIGRNKQNVEGIMGAQVAREVFALKNAGVKELDVWINSAGGNYYEGLTVHSALNDSGLKVNTFNKGVADSTAGWVFQAGSTRTWEPYALGLMHNIQSASKGQDHIVEAMNFSVATMYAAKTKKTVDEVLDMMKTDAIMTAEQARRFGFCDNDPEAVTTATNFSTITEAMNYGEQQIKKTLPKNSSMESIDKLLGLQNEASEEARATAIQALITAKNEAVTKVTTLETTLATTTDALNTANATILTAQNEAKQTAAKAMIAPHIGKRIANDPAIIAKWEGMAVADLDGTKTLIESMNLSVKAPERQTEPATGTGSMAEFMAQKDLENKKKRK